MNEMAQRAIDRVSPNVLVVTIAVLITLMQLGSAYWVRQATSTQRIIDINAAIERHMKDPNPHNSDLGKSLDANQRDVQKRLAVMEALLAEQHARLDRLNARMDSAHGGGR